MIKLMEVNGRDIFHDEKRKVSSLSSIIFQTYALLNKNLSRNREPASQPAAAQHRQEGGNYRPNIHESLEKF